MILLFLPSKSWDYREDNFLKFFKISKNLNLILFCAWGFCLHVCLCTYACSPHGGHKRASDSLEQELQTAVSHHVDSGNQIWILCKNSPVLNYWASLSPFLEGLSVSSFLCCVDNDSGCIVKMPNACWRKEVVVPYAYWEIAICTVFWRVDLEEINWISRRYFVIKGRRDSSTVLGQVSD